MGIHIHVRDSAGHDHAAWDWLRHAGDSEFLLWTDDLPYIEGGDDGDGVRPVDFSRWRASLPSDRPNPARFPALFDLLEREKNLWLHFSF